MPEAVLARYQAELQEQADQRATEEEQLQALLAAGHQTLPEVAETLGCSRAKVYSLAQDGELEVEHVAGRMLVSEASLDRDIQQHMSTGTAATGTP